MNEVPSYFQLMTSFDNRCTHQCKTCRFGGVHCRAEFFYNIFTGSMTLDDSFEKLNSLKPTKRLRRKRNENQ